ncbi:hypothetical protein E2C01_040992 [Portunus trituberculatus]|uniref:Uncharacterized protein n=1 Tax=Portunus trituberculatus TaxID=210409 RepID=A0A5B7FIU8_PORTR|nr:hypothetical protein [Portunus trituberculatus]
MFGPISLPKRIVGVRQLHLHLEPGRYVVGFEPAHRRLPDTTLTTLFTTPPPPLPRPAVSKTHRPMPDSALREFGQWMTHHPWTELLEVDDVHTKWHNYVTTTPEAFHHYFPAERHNAPIKCPASKDS